jgi:hypothetical protein
MTALWQDIVYDFRMLLKKPAFTIVAAMSLALGTARTQSFSVLSMSHRPYANDRGEHCG